MPVPPRLKVAELGHVSLFVRDLDATRRFYHGVLGLAETGTGKGGRIVFFSAGRHHHDVSCELARLAQEPAPKGAPGLYHVAFAIGRSLDDLRAARAWVEAHGLTPFGETERGFCVRDPDGHEVELYVEVRSSRHGSERTRQTATRPAASATTTKAKAGR